MLVVVGNSRATFEIDKLTNSSTYRVDNLTIDTQGMIVPNPTLDSYNTMFIYAINMSLANGYINTNGFYVTKDNVNVW